MKKLHSIKSILPQTLMGRSLLILVVPVILTQIIAAIIFFDNHWDKITARLAYGLAGEIAIAAEQIEEEYTPEIREIEDPRQVLEIGLIIAFPGFRLQILQRVPREI